MKRFILYGLGLVAVLAVVAIAVAQCGPAGHVVLPAVQFQPVDEALRWVPVPTNTNQVALYRGRTQLGVYDYETGFYWGLDGKNWTGIQRAPVTPPLSGLAGSPGNGAKFGVVGNLNGPERVWEGPTDYTRVYLESMLKAELQDDSRSGHITVISKDPAVRSQVARDWEALQAQNAAAAKTRFQVYDPDAKPNQQILAPHRLDIDRGYQATGTTVIAQPPASEPDGRSKERRWYQYTGEEIWIEALRFIDPAYDPNTKPRPLLRGLPTIPDELWIMGGGTLVLIVAFVFRPKR